MWEAVLDFATLSLVKSSRGKSILKWAPSLLLKYGYFGNNVL